MSQESPSFTAGRMSIKRKVNQYDCLLGQIDFNNARECNMFDIDLIENGTYVCNEYNCLFIKSIQLS